MSHTFCPPPPSGGLEGVSIKNNATGAVTLLPLVGLFFAIGHTPATKLLGGQLELDSMGYIKTQPGSTATSVDGEWLLHACTDVCAGVHDVCWRM
jgi:thioredoxin reductase